MKAALRALDSDDQKARAFFLESLDVCAYEHILSRKLLDRFSTAKGPMYAIIGDWIDLVQIDNYAQGLASPSPDDRYSPGDFPQDRLVSFVREFLHNTPDGVVFCENFGAGREYIAACVEAWPPPKVAWFGDKDVYFIVPRDVTDADQIQAAVMESHHWQTNVCSSCDNLPEGDIPGEAFLDEIVANTRHIFIPAFDGSGFLIWSPQ